MASACGEIQRQIACMEKSKGFPDEILKHLAACPACAREGDQLQLLLESLSAEAVPDPGEAYWQAFLPRLRYRLRVQQRALQGRPGWMWACSGAAASFLLAALVVGRWQVPPETRAQLRLEQVASGNNPESLQQALDTLLPDDPGISLREGSDPNALPNDLSQALEEAFPERETGLEGNSPEAQRLKEKGTSSSLDSGWV